MKRCGRCKQVKPNSQFYRKGWTLTKTKGWIESRTGYCHSCTSDYQKGRRDKIMIRRRKYHDTVVDAYGGKCVCCGERQKIFLTIDHIHQNGAEHRRQVGNGPSLYLDIINSGFPKGEYRILCFNCHAAASYIGYCPHHPRKALHKSPIRKTKSTLS